MGGQFDGYVGIEPGGKFSASANGYLIGEFDTLEQATEEMWKVKVAGDAWLVDAETSATTRIVKGKVPAFA